MLSNGLLPGNRKCEGKVGVVVYVILAKEYIKRTETMSYKSTKGYNKFIVTLRALG